VTHGFIFLPSSSSPSVLLLITHPSYSSPRALPPPDGFPLRPRSPSACHPWPRWRHSRLAAPTTSSIAGGSQPPPTTLNPNFIAVTMAHSKPPPDMMAVPRQPPRTAYTAPRSATASSTTAGGLLSSSPLESEPPCRNPSLQHGYFG
jgi:hypothetical protein